MQSDRTTATNTHDALPCSAYSCAKSPGEYLHIALSDPNLFIQV